MCENFSKIGPIIKKNPKFVNDPLNMNEPENWMFTFRRKDCKYYEMCCLGISKPHFLVSWWDPCSSKETLVIIRRTFTVECQTGNIFPSSYYFCKILESHAILWIRIRLKLMIKELLRNWIFEIIKFKLSFSLLFAFREDIRYIPLLSFWILSPVDMNETQ